MLGLILTVASAQLVGDTVSLDVAVALQRGLEQSPVIVAAYSRAEAASGRAAQATSWRNPTLAVSAENVGQQVEFTGREGLPGLEGQAIVRTELPLGSERSGAIRIARAEERVAVADREATELRIRRSLMDAFGRFVRDQLYAETAAQELSTLTRITEALQLQAELGRAALGDAARADLARGLAATRLGRREAELGRGRAELAVLLGYSPETVVRLVVGRCESLERESQRVDGFTAPSVRAAEAQVEAARGSVEVARGIRLPDVLPELGLRRSGGRTGLYLGVSTQLPFFDRGSRRIAAAHAEESAALAERTAAERAWASGRAGTLAALSALERSGTSFDATWFDSLEQTVVAAEARFEMGEGTLVELLDSRRARLQALDDYHAWLAEWWAARVELSVLEGTPPSPELLCMDPFRELAR